MQKQLAALAGLPLRQLPAFEKNKALPAQGEAARITAVT